MIRQGQIYKFEKKLYVVTAFSNYLNRIHIIQQKGYVDEILAKTVEESELIAEYPTWQQAVNSKEFKE